MRIEQAFWQGKRGWSGWNDSISNNKYQLVLVFGGSRLGEPLTGILKKIKERYNDATIIGCSTSGEIIGTDIQDNGVTVTAVSFDASTVRSASISISSPKDSFQAGADLVRQFDPIDLKHILVFSDGLQVNGSELVKGMRENVPPGVTISGGLAGDGTDFEQTYTIMDGQALTGHIVAAAIYGRVAVGCGSIGGWGSFGPYRRVTRSENNILFELDHTSALELYKKYLGELAQDLPSSGLLFPLSVVTGHENDEVVRTLLSINEDDGGMVYAGDIPQGAHVRLMKANKDRLVAGARMAANNSIEGVNSQKPGLALLVSCVGRRLVLKQRSEEELEAVVSALGSSVMTCGFFSYGEISPISNASLCELHNQTMTVTIFAE